MPEVPSDPSPVGFVGREAELRALRDVAATSGSGRPRTVLIEGAPGIGKTTLVARLLDEVGEARVVRCAGEEGERDLPFGVADQLLRSLTGAAAGGLGAGDYVAVGSAIRDALAASDSRLTVVVVDDVQWVDRDSVRALLFAIRRLVVEPVLTLFCVRSVDASALPEGLVSLAERMTLAPFSADELGALADGLRIELPAAAAQRLRSHTRGIPLHARALLEELPASTWIEGDRPLPAPRSFSALIQARLERCASGTRALVEACAVVGDDWGLSALGTVAGVDEPVPALDEAVAEGLLAVDWHEPGRPVSVAHALVRAAVEQALGPAQRVRLHLAAAATSPDPVTVMRHRAAASPGADEDLADAIDALARAERDQGAWVRAASLWRSAAAVSGSARTADERRLRAIDAYLAGTDLVGARALAATLEPAPMDALRGAVLGRLALWGPSPRDAEPLLEAAWAACDAAHDPDLAADIALRLSVYWISRMRTRRARVWAQRALEIAPGRTPPEDWAQMLLARFRLRAAERIGAGSATLPVLDGEVSAIATIRGWRRLRDDDIAGARAELETALRAPAAPDARPSTMTGLVWALFVAGAWDQAAVETERLLALIAGWVQPMYPPMYPFTWWMLVAVPAARGDSEQAERLLGLATETANDTERCVVGLGLTRAIVAYTRGDATGVLEALDPLRALRAREDLDGPPHEWQHLYADALVDLGRLPEAETILDEYEPLAVRQGRRAVGARLARVRGRLHAARGEYAEAEEAFQAALGWLDGLTMPYRRAAVELAYGESLRRARRRREAAARLGSALATFEALGARPARDRCRRELDACGVGGAAGRAGRAGGGGRLTPQEAAIAERVAAGLRNREIAEELMVSTRTVEFHLTNIYAKLGLKSRAQLVARGVEASTRPPSLTPGGRATH